MKAYILLIMVVVIVSKQSLPAHADEVGRLFTTQEERVYMNKFRRTYQPGVVVEQVLFAEAVEELPAIVEKQLTFNGIVKRGEIRQDVFVNGGRVDTDARKKTKHAPQIQSFTGGDNITVRPSGERGFVQLKPGQYWDADTKQVRELYIAPDKARKNEAKHEILIKRQ